MIFENTHEKFEKINYNNLRIKNIKNLNLLKQIFDFYTYIYFNQEPLIFEKNIIFLPKFFNNNFFLLILIFLYNLF